MSVWSNGFLFCLLNYMLLTIITVYFLAHISRFSQYEHWLLSY